MAKRTGWFQKESGQSLVEVALTIPLVLLLLCGIMESAWVGFHQLTLQNVTRESVRSGIAATNAEENLQTIVNRIQEIAPEDMKDGMTVEVVYSNPADFRSGDITVTARYHLQSLTPLAILVTENGVFYLTASCTMKVS